MATRKTTTTTTNHTNPTTATTTTTTKKAAPRAATTRPTASSLSRSTLHLTPEQRHQWICTAAYYMAEHNGFQGNPVDFWLCAEAQVDQQLHA